jgi:hypothetical protein
MAHMERGCGRTLDACCTTRYLSSPLLHSLRGVCPVIQGSLMPARRCWLRRSSTKTAPDEVRPNAYHSEEFV